MTMGYKLSTETLFVRYILLTLVVVFKGKFKDKGQILLFLFKVQGSNYSDITRLSDNDLFDIPLDSQIHKLQINTKFVGCHGNLKLQSYKYLRRYDNFAISLYPDRLYMLSMDRFLSNNVTYTCTNTFYDYHCL